MNVKTVSNEVVSGIAKVSKKKRLELHEPYFFRSDFEPIIPYVDDLSYLAI